LSSGPEASLQKTVEGSCLAARLPRVGSSFFERRADELSRAALPDAIVRGLARVLASSGETARYLALRPGLLERLGAADAGSLERRARELCTDAPDPLTGDLEGFLDSLRLFVRDETAFAACLDLAGLVFFKEVSSFLSAVAETAVERALAAAQACTQDAPEGGLSVLAMGKLAGRELTYASDLDLIFLYEGEPEDVVGASRVAQRLIHYLTTPTGAGVAYAVDARLRPSGNRGLLVTSFDAYARYQLEQAQPWEHLAVMRARAVAGNLEHAGAVLKGVQDGVRGARARPWEEIARLRARIAAERTNESGNRVAFKTGPGGLIDVDFLAAGAQLERGADAEASTLPSVPSMLTAVASGPTVEGVVSAYGLLRAVEARSRWSTGRAVEVLPTNPEALAVVAELVEPGLAPSELLERTHASRTRVREALERVLAADTVAALEEGR
jgi:glutamate-ammonia-ligase adenylyltransferase